MASFKDGYQKIYWNSQAVHVYKQKDNQEIGLLSTPKYKEVRTITALDDDEHVFYCKLNCSYFVNVVSSSEYGQVLGREQGFTEDNKPDQQEWLDAVVTKDNQIKAGQLASWDWPGETVKCGYSPAVILLLDGQDVTMISSSAGSGKYNNANTQSLHMMDAQGKHYLVAVSGKLNGAQCRAMAKNYGMVYCAMLDSGGSTQMRADGRNVVYTGRKIPNALVFYKNIEPGIIVPEIKPEPEESDMGTRMVKCVKGTLQNGTKYPTRPNVNATYSTTSYLINVGDVLEFDDVKTINGKPDAYFQISGGLRTDLIGRWFAYDKNYFD